jgi:hypothetical protein
MGRYSRNRFEEYQEANTPDESYNMAYKRVKRIKGFYVHALVYVLVNAFIIVLDFNRNLLNQESFWDWGTFSTALFWGIALLAHGMSVFGRDIFFGKSWEKNKIKKLMEKDKTEKWE